MEPLETPPVDQPKSPWRPNRLTSGIVAGGAAFAMVLAGLGIASAQTDDAPSTTAATATAPDGGGPHHGDRPGMRPSLKVAADTLGMSEADLKAQLESGKTLAEIAGDKTDALIAALVKDAEARLDQAVTDGKLTQAQADARKADLTARITDMVNHAPPARGDGDRRGPGPRRGFDGRPNLGLVATTLGMNEADVRAQLEDGKTLAQIAGDKTDALIAALVADATTHLDDAVAHGRLTQAEADARKANLTERMTDIVNRTPPIFDGHGPGGPGRPGHPGMKAGLDAAATALGISPAELRTQLEAGQTIAQVAQAKGVDVNVVITALVDDAKAHLATAIAEGKLTQAEADAKTADLTQRITDMVNRTGPAGGHHDGDHDGDGPPPAPAGADSAPASLETA